MSDQVTVLGPVNIKVGDPILQEVCQHFCPSLQLRTTPFIKQKKKKKERKKEKKENIATETESYMLRGCDPPG